MKHLHQRLGKQSGEDGNDRNDRNDDRSQSLGSGTTFFLTSCFQLWSTISDHPRPDIQALSRNHMVSSIGRIGRSAQVVRDRPTDFISTGDVNSLAGLGGFRLLQLQTFLLPSVLSLFSLPLFRFPAPIAHFQRSTGPGLSNNGRFSRRSRGLLPAAGRQWLRSWSSDAI